MHLIGPESFCGMETIAKNLQVKGHKPNYSVAPVNATKCLGWGMALKPSI